MSEKFDREVRNLGNVYIFRFPFVMSRIEAQNGLDLIFKQMLHERVLPGQNVDKNHKNV